MIPYKSPIKPPLLTHKPQPMPIKSAPPVRPPAKPPQSASPVKPAAPPAAERVTIPPAAKRRATGQLATGENAHGQRAAPPASSRPAAASAADHRQQDAAAPPADRQDAAPPAPRIAARSAAPPAAPAAPPVTPPKPAGSAALPSKKPKPGRLMHCRECGAKSRATAGWYMLRRAILLNSVPPEGAGKQERERWPSETHQYMGCYCSFACLEKSMPRMKDLDRKFQECGTGTRVLE